jgi:hypothetical protein
VNDILPGDNYARARYSELCTALGGEPLRGFHRAVLARLAGWTDQPDIDALAGMIRERVNDERARGDRYRNLVIEVAHHLQTTHPAAKLGWSYTLVPDVLIALLREAARE